MVYISSQMVSVYFLVTRFIFLGWTSILAAAWLTLIHVKYLHAKMTLEKRALVRDPMMYLPLTGEILFMIGKYTITSFFVLLGASLKFDIDTVISIMSSAFCIITLVRILIVWFYNSNRVRSKAKVHTRRRSL